MPFLRTKSLSTGALIFLSATFFEYDYSTTDIDLKLDYNNHGIVFFVSSGKMTHTFLQMLKAEQYYLSGNIIDSYQVHSSAVDLSFDPMSATGYRKYLQKQLQFTSDEWNTILGFNTSEALVSEIQLMIRSKLRVVNNTDSIFSVSYQVMKTLESSFILVSLTLY